MRHLLTLALIALVASPLVACRRNRGPSPEYAEAQGLHDRVLVTLGDDAYLDPQMTQVEALLKSVPADSTDSGAAKELLAKISTERARVTAEKAEAARPEAPYNPVFEEDEEEPAEEAAVEQHAVDAGGEPQPAVGLTVSEFESKFSRCFEAGPEIMLSGVGMRNTYQLKNIASCRDRHPDFASLVLLVEAGRIGGFAQLSALQRGTPQGSEAPPTEAQPQPAQPPAPPPSNGIQY